MVSLVVSDIPGDNPALVASGPTIPGEGSRADALNFVGVYGMKLPDAVMAHLNSPGSRCADGRTIRALPAMKCI